MLKRIIEASSKPGDLVLDCFAGSGTTLIAANELGRQWIGVDIGDESIRVIQERFIRGTKPLGDYVTKKKKDNLFAQSLFDECAFDGNGEEQSVVDSVPKIQYQLFEEI